MSNKKQFHRKNISAIYVGSTGIATTDSYSTGATTADIFIAMASQGNNPDQIIINSVKQVDTDNATSTLTLNTEYSRTTSAGSVGITPLSVGGYNDTESLVINYAYFDRSTEYNDYGNKYNLPDFYGAGLVRRIARDVSTAYK
jgi:hypothetical protein